MKWLFACLLALFMVAPVMAGEDPFVAIVGDDLLDANLWYLSPKEQQFLYDQINFGVPVSGETFVSQMPVIQPEICDTTGTVIDPINGVFDTVGNLNAVVRKQDNGTFAWYIRLPKKPNALNICFQCGVLKPNTFRELGFNAVLECAGYTGERIGTGFCTRDDVNPGQNPIIPTALPQILAAAAPGPYNSFTPFLLTAYRNPGTYNLTSRIIDGDAGLIDQHECPALTDSQALQVLNGTDSTGTRIMLKSCFDKCINIKLPVTGQINAAGQTEADLELGDLILVQMFIPRTNTVDVYCNAQSVKLVGIGEAPF